MQYREFFLESQQKIPMPRSKGSMSFDLAGSSRHKPTPLAPDLYHAVSLGSRIVEPYVLCTATRLKAEYVLVVTNKLREGSGSLDASN